MLDDTWMKEAACRGRPTEDFFGHHRVTAEIRKLCEGCPVNAECDEYAMGFRLGDSTAQTKTKPLTGIWAGKGDRERTRRRQLAAKRGKAS